MENSLIVMEKGSPNDFCRFCKNNMRIAGEHRYSSKIFDKHGKPQSVSERLSLVGVLALKTQKSNRICRQCVALLTRLERDLPVYRRWVEEEKADEASAAASSEGRSEKRDRELTPSKTPRALNKLCHNPPSTGGANATIHLHSLQGPLHSVRHIDSQTNLPERKSVVTQATQARVPTRDCGTNTLTFPLDSSILFLQPTIVKRPSKRPRLSLTADEECPSECLPTDNRNRGDHGKGDSDKILTNGIIEKEKGHSVCSLPMEVKAEVSA